MLRPEVASPELRELPDRRVALKSLYPFQVIARVVRFDVSIVGEVVSGIERQKPIPIEMEKLELECIVPVVNDTRLGLSIGIALEDSSAAARSSCLDLPFAKVRGSGKVEVLPVLVPPETALYLAQSVVEEAHQQPLVVVGLGIGQFVGGDPLRRVISQDVKGRLVESPERKDLLVSPDDIVNRHVTRLTQASVDVPPTPDRRRGDVDARSEVLHAQQVRKQRLRARRRTQVDAGRGWHAPVEQRAGC